jgi:PAS domain S-box-containing protein
MPGDTSKEERIFRENIIDWRSVREHMTMNGISSDQFKRILEKMNRFLGLALTDPLPNFSTQDDLILLEEQIDRMLSPSHLASSLPPANFLQEFSQATRSCSADFDSAQLAASLDPKILYSISSLLETRLSKAIDHADERGQRLPQNERTSQTSASAASETTPDRLSIERSSAIDRLAFQKFITQIFHCYPEGIIVLDKHCSIIFWNMGAQLIFGYNSREIIGKSFSEIIADDFFANIKKVRDELNRKGYMTGLETEVLRKDKQLVIIEKSVSVIRTDLDEIFGYIVILKDITAQKQLENKCWQSNRMANLGTLLASTAHELNHILHRIINFAHEAEAQLDQTEWPHILNIIYHSGLEGKQICEDILGCSTDDKGKYHMCDLARVIEDTLRLVQREYTRAGIKIIKRIESVPKVRCELGKLRQVFLNLYDNARDAIGSRGGAIMIAVRMIRSRIIISVSDNGCGIAPCHLPHIFKPFYTAKEECRTGKKGIGLGLAISNDIIRRHQGTMEVKSRLGRGTSFIITLPLGTPLPESLLDPTDEAASLKKAIATLGPCRILIVEDDMPMGQLIEKIFQGICREVQIRTDGQAALDLLKKNHFDIVISDIVMPGMDGFQLLSKMQKISPQTRGYLISGWIDEQAREKAQNCGAAGVLQKPFDVNELIKFISRSNS